jgi:CHRD domain
MQKRLMFAVTAAVLTVAGLSVACSDDPTGPAPVVFTAALNAANEKQANPINSPATGTATLTLRGNDSLDITVMATGLTAAAVASHIHVGGIAVSGGIITPFTINGGVSSGTVVLQTIVLSQVTLGAQQVSGDSVKVLLNNGNGYVNVHTSTNPGGEIRGQIVRQ